MVRQEPFEQGNLRGVHIYFDEVDDVLPLHTHPVGSAHITFVRRGRLLIIHPRGNHRIVEPGALLKFDPDEEHGYRALEPNSKITNVIY